MITEIQINKILPSPYQHRKSFNPSKLQELSKSIKRDGLIEPVVARKKGNNYELIAGERRVKACEIAGLNTILARIVDASDIQARRMCAAENLQREDLSAIEELHAIIEMVDAELIEDEDYKDFGNTPVERVKWLLMKLDSDRRNETYYFTSKFAGKIESIFKNLPKPKEWISFYTHDFCDLVDVNLDVEQIATENKLNKSQIKELNVIKKKTPDLFNNITKEKNEDGENILTVRGETVPIKDVSSRELKTKRKIFEFEEDLKNQKQQIELGIDKPLGLFDVIVIDPPWPYGTKYNPNSRRVGNPYPEMQLDEIAEIKIPADENCVLWLWTTHKFMRHSFEIIDNWGFRDVSILTWCKNKIGIGVWLRSKSEFCIMAVKGNPIINLTNQTTILNGKMREHSRKPDEFYQMIDSLCIGRKLDYFSREKRKGWYQYGNELERFNNS